jgi:hypothetical protein
VGLIATPFASSLFGRSHSAERLADGVRPAMTKEALAADRSGYDAFRGAVADFNGPARATIARALGESPRGLDSFIRTRFPDVASGSRLLPAGFIPHAGVILNTLERNRGRFKTADSFPVGGISPRAAPGIFIALGAVLVIAGLVALRGGGRGPVAALFVLALVTLVVAFALSLPHKASTTDRLLDRLSPVFSEQTARRVPGESMTVQGFVRQLEHRFLPAVERRLGKTPRELDDLLAGSSPRLVQALPRLDGIAANFAALGTALVNDRRFYVEAAKIPSRTLVWLLIGTSFVLLATSGPALVAQRSRPAIDGHSDASTE